MQKSLIGTHKTTIRTDKTGAICVQYHRTIVAKRHADGSVMLDNGGWQTVTTKKRMNQALQEWGGARWYYVHQVKGEWLISRYDGNGVHVAIGPYVNGMTLAPIAEREQGAA